MLCENGGNKSNKASVTKTGFVEILYSDTRCAANLGSYRNHYFTSHVRIDGRCYQKLCIVSSTIV
jgi:hypothetical protein